jgi:hypothetical protein
MKLNEYSVFDMVFLTKPGGISFVPNEPCQTILQLEERVKEVKTM